MILAILCSKEGLTETVTEDIELYDLSGDLAPDGILGDVKAALSRIAKEKAIPRYYCPHCEKPIDCLSFKVPVSGRVEISDNFDLDHWATDSKEEWTTEPTYFCVDCGKEITPANLEAMGIRA